MIHVTCDRCGKDIRESVRKSPYDRIQSIKPGDYIGTIMKVVETEPPYIEEGDEVYRNDYITQDLCDDCAKEFNELIGKFMNAK